MTLRAGFRGGLAARWRTPPEALGTLLWVHGLGESGRAFEAVSGHPGLARWRHWIPDLPGYGRSPWPERPVSLEGHAERLGEWLEAVEVTPPLVLVGHSMGGVVGELFLRAAPRRAAAFVDVEGNVSPADCTTSQDIAALGPEALHGDGMERLLDDLYRRGVDDPPLRGYHASLSFCHRDTLSLNSHELLEMSAAEDQARRLAALDVPVLYLLGDPRGTGERSRRLLEVAGVPWRAIEDAGHWPYLDHPGRFVERLTGFLDEHGLGGPERAE